MKKMTCAEARQIDLVDYLTSLGYYPKQSPNNNYWYLSPLRNEKKASFKVDRNRNIWYDHGTGQGGDFIDFGILYHQCSVRDLLVRLSESNVHQILPFLQPPFPTRPISQVAGEKESGATGKIIISDVRPLLHTELLSYLKTRCILPEIAARFCKEVDFTLYNKKQTAIGFQNNLGGYELRNKNFKGSNSPKAPTFIDNKSTSVLAFEGFFDFLSYHSLQAQEYSSTNFLVLNSLAFFEKQRPRMEEHEHIHLFLDRDVAGRKTAEQALKSSSKYIDESHLYANRKDLNEWLIQTRQSQLLLQKQDKRPIHKQKKSHRHGRI